MEEMTAGAPLTQSWAIPEAIMLYAELRQQRGAASETVVTITGVGSDSERGSAISAYWPSGPVDEPIGDASRSEL
jgi:hypothetical protein